MATRKDRIVLNFIDLGGKGKYLNWWHVKIAKTNESKSSTRKTNYGKKLVYEDEGN